MATIGGIGVGLFILIFIWVVCLFLSVALSRAQGAISNAPLGIILFAIIITLTLLLFPRGPADTVEDYTKYDDTYQYRTAIVSVCGIFLFLGLIMLVPMHLFEQLLARPLKTRRGIQGAASTSAKS